MAFQLDITTTYGINCNYWKISKVEKDYFSSTAYVEIKGWVSKETRDQMNSCLEKRFINVYPENFDNVFGMEKT